MEAPAFSIDLEVYRSAAALLRVNAEEEDRRSAPRHTYDALVSIAPHGPVVCEPESFIPVRCKDLSRGGISFVSQALDARRQLVVQLHTDPPMRMVARVVRQTPIDRYAFAHLISCQFVGKAAV